MHSIIQGPEKSYPDVQAQRTVLVKVLTMAGYRVLHSASVCEAVQQYERLSDSIVWVWMVGLRRLCHHGLYMYLGRKQHFLILGRALYAMFCSWSKYTQTVSGCCCHISRCLYPSSYISQVSGSCVHSVHWADSIGQCTLWRSTFSRKLETL